MSYENRKDQDLCDIKLQILNLCRMKSQNRGFLTTQRTLTGINSSERLQLLYGMKIFAFSYDMEAGSDIENSSDMEAGINMEKL